MRSNEVLREAAEIVGVKALASELRLSPALIYKWCQEGDSSGFAFTETSFGWVCNVWKSVCPAMLSCAVLGTQGGTIQE